MALKIIKINKADYAPIQNSGSWQPKAFYIVKNKENLSDLYIEGELCGQYDDTEINKAIAKIETELNTVNEKVNSINTDKYYLHKQTAAEKNWIITHNMGKFPSVTVIDSAGNSVVGDVTYIDENSLSVTFSGAFSGKAILN